jgi:hypothetical protein
MSAAPASACAICSSPIAVIAATSSAGPTIVPRPGVPRPLSLLVVNGAGIAEIPQSFAQVKTVERVEAVKV